MVRVFNRNAVVCEIVMLLEDNGVPLGAVEDVLACVREEIGAMPVVIATPGLPTEMGEEHGDAVIDEFRRRKSAYCIGCADGEEPEEPVERTGDDEGCEPEGVPEPMEHEFSFGLPGTEGTEE